MRPPKPSDAIQERAAEVKKARLARLKKPSWNDVLFVVGIAMFAGGLGWIYHPLAPIVAGAAVVAIAWTLERAAPEQPDTPGEVLIDVTPGADLEGT